jgi:hypothetical protein
MGNEGLHLRSVGMNRIAAATALAVLVACTTWRGRPPIERGLTIGDLACAKTFMVGETPHPGMPLLPMDADHTRRVSRRIRRSMPELTEVFEPSQADVIISVIFVPALPICIDCAPEQETEWSAIIEKGGPGHMHQYPSTGPYLVLQGRTIFGVDVIGAFCRQFARLRASRGCTAVQRGPASPPAPSQSTSTWARTARSRCPCSATMPSRTTTRPNHEPSFG